MMKLAVSSYSLLRWRREQGKTLDDCVRLIAGLGVGAVEFAGLDDDEPRDPVRRAKQLRRLCDRLGLTACGYCVPAQLLVPPAEQRRQVDKLKQHVDVAQALGVTTMRHDVGRGWQTYPRYRGRRTFAQALRVVVPAIREVTRYAADRGIGTSLENHGFYFQHPDAVEKVIVAVRDRNYALTLDMGNFLCVDSDPVAAVRQLVRYARMVHVKDFHVRDKRTMPARGWFATPTKTALRGAIVGHGDIDIPAQLRILRRARYAGYVSLEFEGMEDPVLAVTLGVEYLRKAGLG